MVSPKISLTLVMEMANQWIFVPESQEATFATSLTCQDDYAYAILVSNTQVALELARNMRKQSQPKPAVLAAKAQPSTSVRSGQLSTLSTLDWLQRHTGTKRPSTRACEPAFYKKQRLN
ncbi:hypothetical protein PIIN_01454 [Serendipita indica DSM 11827]|uniref:Uncharacterized protein n=1 Tax=Serendipita indica (strain DSM 11827) TaxID=1109443 RepID=G4T8I1_SERID|nr:hypothetical protein PIIN_01454 [Serendipita indica DSM 11827]